MLSGDRNTRKNTQKNTPALSNTIHHYVYFAIKIDTDVSNHNTWRWRKLRSSILPITFLFVRDALVPLVWRQEDHRIRKEISS